MTEMEKIMKQAGHSIQSLGDALFPDIKRKEARWQRANTIVQHQKVKLITKRDAELAERVCEELEISYERLKQIY
jgi:uncharacterized protein YukE